MPYSNGRRRDEKCQDSGRANPRLSFARRLKDYGRGLGFTTLILCWCGILFVVTLLHGPEISGGSRWLLPIDPDSYFLFGASGATPIFDLGRWWTVLSAAWLHSDLIHILLNLLWISLLVPELTEFFGVERVVIIYTISSIAGFGLTSVMFFAPLGDLRGAAVTLGASTPLFGLFGALVLQGKRTGNRLLSRRAWLWVIIIGGLGLFMKQVDFWAHLGGFLGGWLAARHLHPLEAVESPRYLAAAVACLGATLLAIIVSVLHGQRFIG